MDFGLSSEQRLLVDTVRQFIANELEPLETEVEQTGKLASGAAGELLRKSRELGLYAMNIPTEFGGGGLSTVDWMLVEEQFGRTSDVLVRRTFGNVYDVLLEANPAQKERWLVPSVRGERTFSIAFSEPEAGSDAAAIRTAAKRDGEGWVLSGHKHFISDALHSDFFLVTAVTDPQAGPRGISMFIVDKGTHGFSVGEDQPMMGLRGTSHAELFFDGVRLGPQNLLGQEGKGLKLALTALGRVRLAQIGARAIGKATRILEAAVEHARQRRQFGRAIGEFQMVGKMLADSAIEISAARLLLLQTAWMIDQGAEAREQISMVKVQSSETLGRIADRAVQVFGGSGYSKELPVERFFRDARIFRIFDGTSEVHRSVIARGLMAGRNEIFGLVA